MPSFDNAWSRVVFWLKIILPLVALGILSTLFLLSHDKAPGPLLPYARVDIEGLAREERLGGAEVSGMTKDGAAITLSAATARPARNGAPMSADDVRATYVGNDGFRAEIKAATAELPEAAESISLRGDVRLDLSDGTAVRSEALVASLTKTEVASPGQITAKLPFGTLDAGAMTLTQANGSGTEVLVFNNGVRLVYRPKD